MNNSHTARNILDELSKNAGDENVRLRAAELLLIHGEPNRNQEEKFSVSDTRSDCLTAASTLVSDVPEGLIADLQTTLYNAHSILVGVESKLDDLLGSQDVGTDRGHAIPKTSVAYAAFGSAQALVDRLNKVRDRLNTL